ncbi:hypothetical protein B484DRAFT_468718, partial [Ochromonadaceae sp. CCMP2298]
VTSLSFACSSLAAAKRSAGSDSVVCATSSVDGTVKMWRGTASLIAGKGLDSGAGAGAGAGAKKIPGSVRNSLRWSCAYSFKYRGSCGGEELQLRPPMSERVPASGDGEPNSSDSGSESESEFERDESDSELEDCLGEASAPAVNICLALLEDAKPKIVNSGAKSHCVAVPENVLSNFTKKTEHISPGNSGFKVKSEGRGNLGPLLNAMHHMWAPGMSYSMASVSTFDKEGSSTYLHHLRGGKCLVVDSAATEELQQLIRSLRPASVILTASLLNRLYHVDSLSSPDLAAAATSHLALPADGVTVRKNQISFEANLDHASQEATGTDVTAARRNGFSSSQESGADGIVPYAYTANRKQIMDDSSRFLARQEVGFDQVMLSTPTLTGNIIANLGVCYWSKLFMLYTAKSDSEAQQIEMLEQVKRDWCTRYGHTIGVFHSDFASVFAGKQVGRYLLSQSIKHDCSAPHQHSHNLVESMCIRVIINRARVLLA